ncbi:MAG: glycoside hydrolase family 25 protein [Acidobacteria bacterium]|nr:glycoside hydrolase family 25 protein [Acidobacteriota bacterium]MCA1641556.1 glycoside hydrolase family 25 protein [Acidobacteriota bacterium]
MAEPLNVVIDISHHNGNVNLDKAKADGILGVIQKATQGQAGADPTYKTNRTKATNAGLLWGAYHFATGSDGVKQAQNFLNVVGNPDKTLLVLDFEPNPTGPSMSLDEARAFVTHVQQETGRFPGLYSGHFIKQILGVHKDPVLAQCWFWLAQYGPTPVVPPNWDTWTMWQYTDGAIGPPPHKVSGVGRCDRDKFNGSETQLNKLWVG